MFRFFLVDEPNIGDLTHFSHRHAQRSQLQLNLPKTTSIQALAEPLPFSDDSFDDIIASLVLHYLQDWKPTLSEMRRVLKSGGRLIVSVDHPFAINLMHRQAGPRPDYFETYNWTEEWTMGGQAAQMSFWHRPLHAMTDAFTAAGFRISVISEPHPVSAARDVFPDDFHILDTFPSFLFFVLQTD